MRTISILFDDAYSEPALITAQEVLRSGLFIDRLVLVYAPSGNSFVKPTCDTSRVGKNPPFLDNDTPKEKKSIPGSTETISNVTSFIKHYEGNSISVKAIKIGNLPYLDLFSHAHFNSSIIKKLLIPDVLGDASRPEVIINLDAGFVFGSYGAQVLETIFQYISNSSSLIGCFCHSFNKDFFYFHEVVTRFAMSEWPTLPKLYPAGTLLAFKGDNWLKQNFSNSINFFIAKEFPRLRMAEQEILMLCCKDEQLLDLHLAFPEGSLPSYFLTPFINDRSAQFSTRRDLIRAILDNQFGLYKIVGSFKPWQDDFHDLVKLPYQERARDLYMSIPSLDPQSFAAFRRFTQKEVGGKPISQIMRLNLESDFYRSIAEELTR